MGVEELKKQVRNAKGETKVYLIKIQKGMEQGRKVFYVIGNKRYEILSILLTAGVDYSYENGILSID